MLPNPAIVIGLMFIVLNLYFLTKMVDEVAITLFITSLAVLYLVANGASVSLTADTPADIYLMDWIEPTVLFFLMFRMIIIESVKETGLFDYVTLSLLKRTGADPVKLWITLAFLTHIIALMTGPVTAILIVGSIISVLGKALGINIAPFLIGSAIISTISSAGLMTSDVPNILIATVFNISFFEYLTMFLPITLAIVIAYIRFIKKEFREDIIPREKINIFVIKTIDPWVAVESKSAFYIGFTILLTTVVGFLFFQPLPVALINAVVSLILLKREPKKILAKLHWDALFMVAGLILLTNAMRYAGTTIFIEDMMKNIVSLPGFPFIFLILTSIFSLVMDNTALVLMMQDSLKEMFAVHPGLKGPVIVALNMGNVIGNLWLPMFTSEMLLAFNMIKENQPQNEIPLGRYYKVVIKMYLMALLLTSGWIGLLMLL